jgi:alpha-mannosidase
MRTVILAAVFAAVVSWSGRTCPAAQEEFRLKVADAAITGGAEYYPEGGYPGGEFIGSWRDPKAKVEWEVIIEADAKPQVRMIYSCAPGCGGQFQLQIGDRKLTGKTESTGGWYEYQTMNLGPIALAKGAHKVMLTAGPFKTAPMNIQAIVFSPLKARVVPQPQPALPPVYVVPNFHPASCGWLANWSVERNYCANSYLDHLDRIEADKRYALAISEVNNMIAILNFQPKRFEELKARIKEGRVEPVNAFFLEPTINLSGGEALVKMGVEGLRWQRQMLGVRPRFAWTIDVCGTHAQMAQICAGLGLEAMIYTRGNRTGKTIFRSESPDGSSVLTLVPGHYSELGQLFAGKEPPSGPMLRRVQSEIARKVASTPAGAPILILAGSGDYALAPVRKEYPSEFLEHWKAARPDVDLRFATVSQYVDALLPLVRGGKLELPVMRGDTSYDFKSFWIQCPKVKAWYRRDEHGLQAAETLATVASLKSDFAYPVQPFHHAWLQMCLNMDRNTLWGAAGGMVFEDETSWDARDRFQWVQDNNQRTLTDAGRKLLGSGSAVGLFNPANWRRTDPVQLALPTGTGLAGAVCEPAGDGEPAICRVEMPSVGTIGLEPTAEPPKAPEKIALPQTIETAFYTARVDPQTGALVSLKVKPSGRELLGGPANEVVIEQTKASGDPGDQMHDRPERQRLAWSSQFKPVIAVTSGALAITVDVRSDFYRGSTCRRVMRFYKDFPRIDFRTELTDLPNLTVTVAEFPLAESPKEIRRGIPFGFSHGAWGSRDPNLPGWTQGIVPAVRWSDYALPGGGGLAILDRGLTGREINDKTPVLYLYNATDKYYGYPNAWLSGRGSHRLEYAIVPRDGPWSEAGIPRRAWEYNCPPVLISQCAKSLARSFVQTSDNVIVEVVRREGADIEVRLAECLGAAGTAQVTVDLPHEHAALTDLLGGNPKPLEGGPTYRFPVRPQQIVTMRLRTAAPVADVQPLTQWDELVPAAKREALRKYLPGVKGHPPRGN